MDPHIVAMSNEAQYCLMDMIELAMYLERFNGEMPWAIRRRGTYALQKPARKTLLPGTVSSATARALLQLGLIEQASGDTFVVSKTGQEYYEQYLKPKA
jgi:uncharacterized iron-regulated membrane protein